MDAHTINAVDAAGRAVMSEVTREHLAGLELAKQELGEFNAAAKAAADYCLDPLIAQASAAPEQEPVAWLYSRPEGLVTPVVLLEKASDKDRGSWDETPLYNHADPSEVAQLRAELKSLLHTSVKEDVFDIVCKERDAATQRADAAERKLGDAVGLLKAQADHVVQLCDVMFRQGLGMDKEAETKIYAALRTIQHINALLSASAEPAKGGDGEVLGERCIDGGVCHHDCKTRCFRRVCCGHFSDYTGPWAYPAEGSSHD